MRLREHPGIGEGRTDILPCDPHQLSIMENYNVRDLSTPEAREELDELKAKVKAHGVRTPLVVRFDGEKIFIVEGHKRHKVALELIAEHEASGGTEGRNIDFVPITAEKLGTNDIDRDYGLETSNSGSRLKPLELANLIYRLHTQRGQSLEQIADGLGKSLVVIKNHLAMRAMPEEVKEHVREGDISATEAAKLVKNLPKGTDPTEAAKIIAANKEENKKIIGDKKRSTKVTRKTLERGKAKPEPKAAPVSDPPKPEPDLPSALAAISETTQAQAFSPLSDETPPVVPEPTFRDVGEAPPVHEQLQAAAARENGHTSVTALVSVDGGPMAERVVTYPNRQAVASSEIQKVLGELSLIAEDNALSERDPDETLPIKVSLIARCDRLYRQMIGDTTADEAA